MAPVLSFTAEEVWLYFSGNRDDKSVHMSSLADPMNVSADKVFVRKWGMLTELKSEVSKALELCRQEKVIGHSLDARVRLVLPEGIRSILNSHFSDLKFIFIVSSVEVVTALNNEDKIYSSENLEGLKVGVCRMGGQKCERCWNYFEKNSFNNSEHSTICSRCITNLESVKA